MRVLELAFFAIALIYSAAGFAGGSSYLLALAMAGFTQKEAAPVALVCNLVVSGVAFLAFAKRGHFRARLAVPFLAASVPMAFVGSKIALPTQAFHALLALALAFAAFRLFFLKEEACESAEKASWKGILPAALPAGGVMGFFSGLLGIGGGVFLSPFLILTKRASLKQASAAASFFIFANSLAGLAGKMPLTLDAAQIVPLGLFALAGGFLGSRLGSSALLPERGARRVLSGVLFYLSYACFLKGF